MPSSGARRCVLPIHCAGCLVEHLPSGHGLGQCRQGNTVTGDPGENLGTVGGRLVAEESGRVRLSASGEDVRYGLGQQFVPLRRRVDVAGAVGKLDEQTCGARIAAVGLGWAFEGREPVGH